jgi:polyhydroxyalkanoate synthase
MMTLIDRTATTARYLSQRPAEHLRIGVTPHQVVFRQNKATLRYFPSTHPQGQQHTPIFVSMPLINKWEVWDLLPGRSVMEDLTAAGVPVYLLDWGTPGPEDQAVTLGKLVDDLLVRMFDRARRHAGQALDAVGYCVGGTFLAVHLSRHESARRAAFVCTPIDFHASGRLAVWAQPSCFPVDAAIDGFGNYPGRVIREAFSWLRPEGQTRKWVGLWEKIEDPEFRDLWAALEKWNTDAVDFPGEAYREYVKRCYFENTLLKHVGDPGVWMLDGKPVDLQNAKIEAHSIAADRDHIVPPAAAHALAETWGGAVTTKTVKGGHVAIAANGVISKSLLEWIRR